MTDERLPQPQFAMGELFNSRPDRRILLGHWLDPDATAEFCHLIERLQCEGTIPGRAVDPGRLHVTLLHLDDFVGQIPSSLMPTVRTAVSGIKAAPFSVTFDRVVCTPNHVLLVPSDELTELKLFQLQLRSALTAAGLSTLISPKARRAMDRPFNPHVTLSYNPGNGPEVRVAPIRWIVREFHLVESLLGKHKHIRLDTWPLHT